MNRRSFVGRLLAVIPGSQILRTPKPQKRRIFGMTVEEIERLYEKAYADSKAPVYLYNLRRRPMHVMIQPGDFASGECLEVGQASEGPAEQHKTPQWSRVQSVPKASEPQRDHTDESLESRNTYGVRESPSAHPNLGTEATYSTDEWLDHSPLGAPIGQDLAESGQPELDHS